MQDKTLQVGEVARQAGVTLRTVRYYEERGLLPAAERTSGGMRLYGLADVARLKLIVRLKALGLGLADIEEALGSPGAEIAKTERVERTHELLIMQRERVQEQIDELVALQGDIDEALDSVQVCQGCSLAECPPHCVHLKHLVP